MQSSFDADALNSTDELVNETLNLSSSTNNENNEIQSLNNVEHNNEENKENEEKNTAVIENATTPPKVKQFNAVLYYRLCVC